MGLMGSLLVSVCGWLVRVEDALGAFWGRRSFGAKVS